MLTHNVDDEAHLLEELVHLAARAAKHGVGQPPAARARALPANVLRDLVAGKVPHLDVLVVPLHGVHAAAGRVESVAVRRRAVARGGEAAANVLGAHGAVRVALRARVHALDGWALRASVGRVRRDDVLVRRVDALDDVHLAARRPVGAVRPDYKCICQR